MALLITYGRGTKPLSLTGRQFVHGRTHDLPLGSEDERATSNRESRKSEQHRHDAEDAELVHEHLKKHQSVDEAHLGHRPAPVPWEARIKQLRRLEVESAQNPAVKPRKRRLPVREWVCISARSHNTAPVESSNAPLNDAYDTINGFTSQSIGRQITPQLDRTPVLCSSGDIELSTIRKRKQVPSFKPKPQLSLQRNKKLVSRHVGGKALERIGDGFNEAELLVSFRRLLRNSRRRNRKSYLMRPSATLAVALGPLPEVQFECSGEGTCKSETGPGILQSAFQVQNHEKPMPALSGAVGPSQRRSSFRKHRSLITAQLTAFKAPARQHLNSKGSNIAEDAASSDVEDSNSNQATSDDGTEELDEASCATSTKCSSDHEHETDDAELEEECSFQAPQYSTSGGIRVVCQMSMPPNFKDEKTRKKREVVDITSRRGHHSAQTGVGS